MVSSGEVSLVEKLSLFPSIYKNLAVLVGAYTLDEGKEALLNDLAKGIGDAHFGTFVDEITPHQIK